MRIAFHIDLNCAFQFTKVAPAHDILQQGTLSLEQ